MRQQMHDDCGGHDAHGAGGGHDAHDAGDAHDAHDAGDAHDAAMLSFRYVCSVKSFFSLIQENS